MHLTRNQIVIIGIAGLIVLFFILLFLRLIPGLQPGGNSNQQINLTAWGIDDPTTFQTLIDGYAKVRPGVKITYAQIPAENYESALIGALAAGSGPDILMFNNYWLAKHSNKIYPVPRTQYLITQLEQHFPKVVEQDFVSGGQIYALPLYIDTLALLYNKNTFDANAIALPPTNWSNLEKLIPTLRQINQSSQLTKQAAAIGGSEASIDRGSDLLSNIMMQFGNPQSDSIAGIRFDNNGESALNFYLQFANPSSPYYTWNDNLPNSLNSFSHGQTAMIFAYNSALPTIKTKNPFLSIGVAPFPQLTDTGPMSGFCDNPYCNSANYWGLAVSKQSRNPTWAWDFIIISATNSAIADNYLGISRKPPALRVLINKYLNDPQLGVFAKQALTARSWPEPDNSQVRRIFSGMIQAVLSGRLSTSQALSQAANQIGAAK